MVLKLAHQAETRASTDRNNSLLSYYRANLKASYEEVGNIFGISRQRAHQIIHKQLKRQESVDRDIMISECHKHHPDLSDDCLALFFHTSPDHLHHVIEKMGDKEVITCGM